MSTVDDLLQGSTRSLRAKSGKEALGMTGECGRIGSRGPDSRESLARKTK